jgi:hypothetical protein
MAHPSPGRGVDVVPGGGEHPLPRPAPRRLGQLSRERQRHRAVARGEFALVQAAHSLQVHVEWRDRRIGEQRASVLAAFPTAHHELATVQVRVLDPEREALGQAQPRAVE